MSNINLIWSKLIPLKTQKLTEFSEVSGVYRISEKSLDGNYYVIYVGESRDIKTALENILNTTNTTNALQTYLQQNIDFVFRYAVVEDETTRKAIEYQLFKYYLPKFNTEPPSVELDVEANLN